MKADWDAKIKNNICSCRKWWRELDWEPPEEDDFKDDMGKSKEKLRIAAYPTKSTSAIPGQRGMTDQPAIAVKEKKK